MSEPIIPNILNTSFVMYKYFISFSFVEDIRTGFGNCEVVRNAPIMSIQDTIQIALDISNKTYDGVVILNFILLSTCI